ncbi:MAG: FHA domain-containing protein [Phycisphaerae bacterium]
MDVALFMFRDGKPRKFRLPGDRIVLGRDHQCDLRVPLRDVSRQHCELITTKDKLTVRDLGSTNGTYVNGKRVAESPLKPGDQLSVGPVTFVVQIDGMPASPKAPGAPQQTTESASQPAVPKPAPAVPAKPPAAPPKMPAPKEEEVFELDLDDLDFDLDEEGSDTRDLDDDEKPPRPVKK